MHRLRFNQNHQNPYASLILFKSCFEKFVKGEHVELWEWNLLEVIEMTVLSDNIVSVGRDGAINELVVVLVNV